MKRIGGSWRFWGLVVIALVGLVAIWMRPVDDAGPADGGLTSVTSSQRPAMEAILAAMPARFQVDDEGRVIQLVARGPQMTDALAAHLEALPTLEDLQLEGSGISKGGMRAIGQLERLQTLRLDKTQIGDEDLAQLSGLGGLRELFLAECPVGDEGLEAIGTLTGLQVLDLNRTQVTDEGLKRLKDLVNLEKLYLVGTQVTGTGFADFPESNRLTLLNLSETPLSSEGVEPLRRFTRLQSLYLDRVDFDDALLARLMDVVTDSYPRLNGLFLSQTPLGDSAIEPLSAISQMPHLSLVGLNGTRISKQAFMQLATQTPETRYLVDYEAGNN
jgi:hypothetical protein